MNAAQDRSAALLRTWKYVGIDPVSGGKMSGRLTAESADKAEMAARRNGLILVKVSPMSSRLGKGVRRGSASEQSSFLRSLALINTAVPNATEALDIAARQVKSSSSLRPAVDSLLEATATAGVSMADAFAMQADVWGEDVSAIVAAGINSGNLNDSLKTLAQHKTRGTRIKKKIRKAFTKPFLAIAMTFVVMWVAMVRVIPEATEFSADLDVDLPFVTQWAVSGGQFLNSWGIYIVAVVAAAVVGWYFASQSERYGDLISMLYIRAPVTGKIIHGQSISIAAGVVAIGVSARVNAWQSAEWAAQAVTNRRVKAALTNVSDRIAAGDNFEEAAAAQNPDLPYEFAALAKQSSLGVEDPGEHWRVYAEEYSELTEARVDSLSESLGALINVIIISMITFISFAASAPAMTVLIKVIENPSGV